MTTILRQQLFEQIITAIGQARSLSEAIGRKDRELESQLRRSRSSIPLDVAEGFWVHAGNARLRFRSALGSLCESQAGLQVAAAWGYVDQQSASRIVAALEGFGGRLYRPSRR